MNFLYECLTTEVVEHGELFGYKYTIRKMPKTKYLEEYHCGYIIIPNTQHFNVDGKITALKNVTTNQMSDILKVHGGITFHQDFASGIEIGFDTMHAFDTKEIKSKAYVKQEIERIIKELFFHSDIGCGGLQ